MEVTALAGAVSLMSAAYTADTVRLAMLRKAMEAQAATANMLAEVAQASRLPDHLGQYVDTTA